MKHYQKPLQLENTCVAYGDFDGMHKGHLHLIDILTAQGKERGLTSVVLTAPAGDKVLTTEAEKAYLLENTGLDALISCDKEADLLAVALENLGVKLLVVGENHQDLEAVQKVAEDAGVEVLVCEALKEGDTVVTTAILKEAFEAVDFEKVEALCGRPYLMLGTVVHGKALGRTVGMPTANLGVEECKIKPPSGVYGTYVQVDDEVFKAMTNVGKRPTVDNFDYVTIEAFILDFSRDIYDREIAISFRTFVRGVMKFNGLEEVQQQVQKDIQTVRDVLVL